MRKRSRENEGDVGEDFFPLSKRINSLQISGEFTFAQISMPNLTSTNVHHHPVTQVSIGNNHHVQQQSQAHHQQQSNHESSPNYNPELSLEDNPIYYNQNRSLYELYLLRQLRSGKQPYV